MKFLLAAINAKYIHSNPGIYSLKAYAGEAYAPYIDLAEYTINHRPQQILADIYKRKPEVLGFSCYIWNMEMVQYLLPELHKLLPETEIWLGGPEVSFACGGILERFPYVRGIMVGEGEETFLELLQFYLQRERLRGSRDKENYAADEFMVQSDFEIRRTDKAEKPGRVKDLQSIPGLYLPTGYTAERPALDFSRVPFLYEDLDNFENRIIYYESSRGCPFRCSYCLSSIDKQVRLRDFSKVQEELQFFLDRKVPQVKFIDRTFNCHHEHAKAIWNYILERDNGITNFHFEIAADILEEEELALLARMRPGFVQLEIGVQTTNPDTLKEIRRYTNMQKLAEHVRRIRQGENVHIHLDLIAGLPYEDYESFGRSFDAVYAMKPEQLQLGFLKVLKGSYMYERAEHYDLKHLEQPPYEVLFTHWLSYDDVLQLKRVEEMVELYYNSNQFTHTLPLLEQCFDGPFAMYEALADYYETQGYFTEAPARSYRYQVLLNFAVKVDAKREDLYRESLTYDIYLRENAKSRPDFASDIGAHKGEFHAFFAEEDRVRRLLPHYETYDTKQISRMTHLEWFRYPVWDVEQARAFAPRDGEWKPQLVQYKVLFDYSRRNPLTKEAKVHVLP